MIHGINNTTLERRDHYLGHDLLDRRRQQQLPHRRSGQPGNHPGRRPGNAARLYADLANGGTINLSGGGTINLNDPNSFSWAINGNETLVNMDNLIQGQGYILPTDLVPEPGRLSTPNAKGGTL